MRLAFYAPMKAPTHPVPSGDRNIARALVKALEETGAEVTLASDVQTRDGKGIVAVQEALVQQAKAEAARLISKGRAAGWQGWLTYHNYYKAPDLIGPPVCRALDIPYLQVETTRARKRFDGPWDMFARAAEAATDAAQVVFYFTKRDAEALHKFAVKDQAILYLRPFLGSLPLQTVLDGTEFDGAGPILSVGMMRAGDKCASYRIIAETLAALKTPNWRLDIAGDGPARPQVEALMAPFGSRVRFLGQLSPEMLRDAYARSSLMFWPGVNEAVGLVYLEAQAAARCVVAQDRPGMREVLAPGDYPTPHAGADALAARIDQLLTDRTMCRTAGAEARAHIAAFHTVSTAAKTLRAGLVQAGLAA